MNATTNYSAKNIFFLGLAFLGVATTTCAVELVDYTTNDLSTDPSAALRGATNPFSENDVAGEITELGEGRRRLRVAHSECIIYQVDAELGTAEDEETKDFNSEDLVHLWGAVEGSESNEDPGRTWACQFDKKYALEVLGLSDPLVELIGVSIENVDTMSAARVTTSAFMEEPRNSRVQSGHTRLKFKHAVIDRSDNTMYIDLTSAKLSTPNQKSSKAHRRLGPPKISPKVGDMKVLVVRLAMADSMFLESDEGGPAVTRDEIRRYVYENPVSLKNKYETCSYNQMRILPFSGVTHSNKRIEDGITTVELPPDRSNEVQSDIDNFKGVVPRAKMVRYAREAAEAELGDLEKQFDFVMFCLPEKVKGFFALAVLNRYDSYYTSPWCTRPSFQLHEVGHSMGLDHAGELDMYDDKVGFMGYSYNELNGPNMCFNPSNSWYMGWYESQTTWHDPYAGAPSIHGKQFALVGVDDYNPQQAYLHLDSILHRRLVVLQLFQADMESDYYIGFNRRKGINSDSRDNFDEIVVVERLGPADQSARTMKFGSLKSVGDVLKIPQFNGIQGNAVYILLESFSFGKKDAVIRVSTTRIELQPPDQPSPPNPPDHEIGPIPTPPPNPQEENHLKDKDGFQYNNSKRKNCKWVAKNPRVLCFKPWRHNIIGEFWCPATCHGVTEAEDNFHNDKKKKKKEKEPKPPADCTNAADRVDFAFQSNPMKNCNWLKKNLKFRTRRCNKKYKGKRISKYWCPISCKVC